MTLVQRENKDTNIFLVWLVVLSLLCFLLTDNVQNFVNERRESILTRFFIIYIFEYQELSSLNRRNSENCQRKKSVSGITPTGPGHLKDLPPSYLLNQMLHVAPKQAGNCRSTVVLEISGR